MADLASAAAIYTSSHLDINLSFSCRRRVVTASTHDRALLFFDGLATSTHFVRRRRHLLLAVLHTVYRRVIGMTDRRDEKRHNTWFDRGCLAIVLTALIGAVIGAALAPAVSPGDISGDLTQRFDAFFGACIGALVGLLIVVVAGLAHRFRNRNAKPS